MGRTSIGATCALGLLLAGGRIAAADPDPTPDPTGAEPKLIPGKTAPVTPTAPDDPAKYQHKGQFGLSLRTALGLRAIATYDDTIYCGKTDTTVSTGNAPVCSGRAPLELGIEVSYGLAKRIDVLVEADFALEHDFGASASSMVTGPHPVKFSPGARFFFSEGIKSKVFTTAQLVFDFSAYKDISNKDRGNDIGVRNLSGLWYDFTHDYGAYVFVGEELMFARWLEVGFEVGLGVQGRFGH